VSLREIARKVGVAPPSIYRHFPTKEELVLAAIDVGFTELFDAETTAAEEHDEPFDKLHAMARAYSSYLIGRPGLARMMFAANPVLWQPDREVPDYLGHQQAIWMDAVDACVDEGYDAQLSSADVAQNIWASVHGHVVLALTSAAHPEEAALTLSERVDQSFTQLRQLWAGERPVSRDTPADF
jgi:AcrR family transcriptional regulator